MTAIRPEMLAHKAKEFERMDRLHRQFTSELTEAIEAGMDTRATVGAILLCISDHQDRQRANRIRTAQFAKNVKRLKAMGKAALRITRWLGGRF